MPQESFILDEGLVHVVDRLVQSKKRFDQRYSKASFYREAVLSYINRIGTQQTGSELACDAAIRALLGTLENDLLQLIASEIAILRRGKEQRILFE